MNIKLYDAQGGHAVDAAELPGLLKSKGGYLWIDVLGPSEQDTVTLHEGFGFHPLAIEDTRNQRQRPKVEEYPDHLFIIMNSVAFTEDHDLDFSELDVFVGRNYIVTVHKNSEPVIEQAQHRVERKPMSPNLSAGYLLYALVDTVVDSYFPVLDKLDDEIEELSELVLTRPTQDLLNRLFHLRRVLAEMWRVVSQQRDMFNILTYREHDYINYDALQYYLRDVYDHLIRISDTVNSFREIVTGLIDLYLSAVSNRLNRVVNRLSVITIIIGVMTVISGFYGMNFLHTWPPFEAAWGVPFVLLLMGGGIVGLLALFRRLKWF